MRSFKKVFRVCKNNFRKWGANYRIWCIGVLLILITHMFTKEVAGLVADTGVKMSLWLYPFLFGQKFIKLLFFFPLILLFCDAPFVDENQPYVIVRSGRRLWCIGQLLYMALASAAYFLFIMLATVLINLPYIQLDLSWGKLIESLARTDIGIQAGIKMEFNRKLIDYFSPMQAMWFSFFIPACVGFFLGLLIYALNAITNTRVIGVFSASGLLIFDAVIRGGGELVWISPVSWGTIGNIKIEGTANMPDITYIYVALAVLSAILIVIILLANRKKSIQILPPV